MLKDPIPKEFLVQWAQSMIDGTNEHMFSCLNDSELRDMEKKVGEVLLHYSKGLEPYNVGGQRPYSWGAVATSLAVLDCVGSNLSKAERTIAISRQQISQWVKRNDKELDWNKINKFRPIIKTFLDKNGLERVSFETCKSKHKDFLQIKIITTVKTGEGNPERQTSITF